MSDWKEEIVRRLAPLKLAPEREAEIVEELAQHLEDRYQEMLAGGEPEAAARNVALAELSDENLLARGLRQVERRARATPAAPAGSGARRLLPDFAGDARYAARVLGKSPGFTALAVLTLALGIGANTAIFTVIDAVLLRPLSYPNPQQLVTWHSNESQLDIDDIRSQATFFSASGGVNPEVLTYSGGAEPLGVHVGYVDAGLFQAFGVSPMLGRVLSSEEDRFGGPRVAVSSHRFWREYLGGDPKILGNTIELDANRYTIIGVMPAGFAVPRFDLDLYVSLRVAYPEAGRYRGVHFMNSYWRLKPGVTLAQAAAGMATIDSRLARAYPGEEKGRHTVPVPLQQALTGDVRPALMVVFGAVCVVLLIACANFAGLLIARASARRREMVIRAALGGSPGRLTRQTLTESMLLAVLGGAAALPLAAFSIRSIVAAKPEALAHLNAISMNAVAVEFGLAVSLLTGLIFGLAPAWSASRATVTDTLKQEAHNASAGLAGHRFRQALVIGEIALALVLLAGTGLLIKSFARLRSVNPGFDPARVLAINIQLPSARYAGIPKQIEYRRELLDRLNSLPGIHAAMVSDVPLNGSEVTHSLAIEGAPPVPEGDEPEVDTFCVMGDYFGVMRVALRVGRVLTPMDRENSPLVAVVNEEFASQFFPGRSPIGHRIRWARETGPLRWMTIVGVVADVKQYSLAEPPYPAVFTPFAQTDEEWRRWMSVVVRMPDASGNRLPLLKRQIRSLDSQIPLNRIQSMDELLGLSLDGRQFNLTLLGLFAGLAVVLVAIGIYGVTSFSVSQRNHEIGIRIAVGASRADVLKLVIGQGARLAAAGLTAGVLGAFGLTRLLTKLLFGVTATDPLIFAAVVLLMLAVVLLACFVPARRAMRVDPIVALRHE